MKCALYNIKIEVTLEAPYLVHGNDAGRFGLDATLLTDHRERPVLPGTLLAGRIAEVWATHGDDLGGADANTWFGKPGIDSAGGAQRSRLRVEDLVLSTLNGEPFVTHVGQHDFDASRIRQDDTTGAVERGALLIIEQCSLPGARLGFEGIWQSWLEEGEVETLCKQLRAALVMQTQLGAYRGVGFGRMHALSVVACPTSSQPLNIDKQLVRQRFALAADQALCVGARSRRGNVFESSDIISGGVLRGAMAQMLMAQHGVLSLDQIETSKVAKQFEKIRCTHAFPAHMNSARPVPLPQSLVWHKNDIKDAWRHKSPHAGLTEAPAFQTDWKADVYAKAVSRQGWGKTGRHLRVRTDIDTSGKGKDGSLFAYECVAASRDNDDNPTTEWLFDIDLGNIEAANRAEVWTELAEILGGGLAPLGKTDVLGSVRAVASKEPGSGSVWNAGELSDDIRVGDLIPVLLVADAILFPTDAVAGKPDANLESIYREAFTGLLDKLGQAEALRLSHYFATQRMAGGDYIHKRYLMDKDYQPFVLTEAGSVFVFEVKEVTKAKLALAGWEENGLELPPSVTVRHGSTWRHHPFLPQNGFGEVAVLPAHGFIDL